jgi:hypothetical protein
MSAELVTSFLSSVKDLVKYSVVQRINTGDKTQDNILNTIVITLITIIFSCPLKEWYTKLKIRFGKKELTKDNLEYYKKLMNSGDVKFKCVSWFMEKDKNNFTSKIASYFKKIHESVSGPIEYDLDNFELKDNMIKNSLWWSVHSQLKENTGTIFPIHVEKKGIIGIGCKAFKKDSTDAYLFYDNREVLDKFIKMVFKTEENIGNDLQFVKTVLEINSYSYDDDDETFGKVLKGPIYENRNFSNLVSRYKQDILNHIESFRKTNKGESDFGCYGNYNLGIIVYGEPGTGKTFLMKAIANELKRSIRDVDMRTIKTRKAFETLFSKDLNDNIFVLDEFDCVQGIIKNRSESQSSSLESKENGSYISSDNRIEKLKERHLQILSLISESNTNGSGDKPKESHLEKELNSINKQIKDVENELTLDSVLTVLDGVVETRGRVLIACTNHLDKIDPALLRPGRFDLKINLGKFNQEETKELLSKLFEKLGSKEELDMLKESKLKENIYTPTELIELSLRTKSLTKVLDKLRL